ncbi:signal peptidase I [Homoserinibacter sp. GY 40078]|uniref:signal peptidase I n=1 Tax=Homoserinibacter sp. GY 40078 TaxID=2603275 RepID=UPI0011CAC330|nr:signal peptidase I [Homoserinibacter sp. GY 40078]TXK17032.1 signal peptidase I [Homoserinibacter sp. GY 40078]
MSDKTNAGTDQVDSDAERPDAEVQRSRKRGFGLFLRDVAIIIVAAIVISFLIKTFLIRSFYIPSESMEDTLLVNDRIIVNQLEPGLMPLERGDIVVFRDPGGWLDPLPQVEQNPVAAGIDWLLSVVGLTAPDSNDHLIKRVIGLPGDTVECCNDFGQVSVNGVALDESPYVKLPDGVTKVSRDDFEVTVPEGSLWVMGDNRWNSQDSRYNRDKPGNGFVPIENVVGRAILISWPADRWTWLDNYPVTFQDVPDAESTPPAVENEGTPTPDPDTTETSE